MSESPAWVDPACGCDRSPDVPEGTPCPTHDAARLRHRDRCHVCGYRQDLRRDGTLGKHLYDARRGVVCKGSGVTVSESHRIAYGGELV